MRLARKLTLILVLGVCLVFLGFGLLQLRRELAIFDGEVRREHRLIGHTLQVTAGELWVAVGPRQTLKALERADAWRQGVKIRWVSLNPSERDASQPVLPPARLEPVRAGRMVQAVVAADELTGGFDGLDRGHDYLFSYVPLMADGTLAGALELSESLGAREHHRQEMVLAIALGVLLITVLCGVIAALVGAWFVGRPVEKLIAKARRIGAGDLDPTPALRQNDELGELSRELSAMCQQLAAARDRVERETEARIQTLEQLRHADRLTTIGKLASAIAHEVGTPLHVVSNYAKLLKKEPSDQVRAAAATIAEQCRRMTRIVQQILDYARRRGPRKARVDLRDVVEGAVSLLRPYAEEQTLQIELHLGEPMLAWVDAAQLQQAITNLVINAIHASPPESTIHVSVDQVDDPDAPGRSLRITVEDYGSGIDEKFLPQLFDPFFTTKPDGQGTGLGLPITKDIVEEHGGRVTVDTRVGRGSRFFIHLPQELTA